MANNASDGLLVGGESVTGFATLAGSLVTKNGIGVNVFGNATAFGNGKVFSYGNNEIKGNGTDVVGTLTFFTNH